MKLTIGKKLILGFMSVVCLMLVISIVAYFNLKKVADCSDIILFGDVPHADASMESRVELMTARDLLGEYLLATNPDKLDTIRKEFEDSVDNFDMYANALVYGSDSDEFKSIDNGKIYETWIKNGMDKKENIKKGRLEVINTAKNAINIHKSFLDESRKMMEIHKNSLLKKQVILDKGEIEVRRIMEEIDKLGNQADLVMEDLEAAIDKNMDISMKAGDDAVNMANLLILSISIFSITLGLLIGIFISRSISKPVVMITKAAEAIAGGDLNQNIDVRSKDEIGILALSFKKMIESLRYKADILEHIAEGDLTQDVHESSDKDTLGKSLIKMSHSLNELIFQIRMSIDQVASGSTQVSSASQSLSQGATEQASSLEEITSSVGEINSQTIQNSENAVKANELSKHAMENAKNGNEQMAKLVNSMNLINNSAQEIKKIVKTIDDIAFQINLLALNANVEAARAGKYGKGFAVVADEVRNLAVRSTGSVKDTTAMVEEATKNIESGNRLVEATAKQLEEILSSSSKVAVLVEEIAVASKEQTQGVEQVNVGLEQVDQVTQSTTASAEECASIAEELASQSQQLKGMMETFRLKEKGEIKRLSEISPELIDMIKAELSKDKSIEDKKNDNAGKITKKTGGKIISEQKNPNKTINPKEVISLEDTDFGKF